MSNGQFVHGSASELFPAALTTAKGIRLKCAPPRKTQPSRRIPLNRGPVAPPLLPNRLAVESPDVQYYYVLRTEGAFDRIGGSPFGPSFSLA